MSRSSATEENLTELTEKRAPLVKNKSSSVRTSVFNSFSMAQRNTTVNERESTNQISKFDAGRVNAPFVMGKSVQNFVKTIVITKNGEESETSVSSSQFYCLIYFNIWPV
jgi:hypothetical protein